MKNRSWILWGVAVLITVGTAVYQRVTGPTYPLSGEAMLGPERVAYHLERSEAQRNAIVRIPAGDRSASGRIEWRRASTGGEWTTVQMAHDGGFLTGELPVQPPAGKLEYRVLLEKGGATAVIPAGEPAVLRFKGSVPLWVLIPHVLAIFLAMLFSTRAGLEFFAAEPKLTSLSLWTVLLLFVGGMLFGPLVQKYAFDSYWTGWPFGTDLTDNKTAVAFLAWVVAAVAIRRSAHGARWALAAAILLIVVFLIPHSLFGSTLDYSKAGGS